jgi:hypothetical protein
VARRLLWIALGLLLVAGGLYAVGSRGPRGGGAPMEHIDADSRRQLERVLIESERERGEETR